MISRRKFMAAAGLSTGFVLTNPIFSLRGLLAEEDSKPMGLLFSREDVPALKKKLELPLFQEFWTNMLTADLDEDRKFLAEGVEFNNQIWHIPRVCQILEREAFVHLITGESARAELARQAVQTILKFEKWDYFLEAGKYVIGLQRAPQTTKTLSLTFDWLQDVLSEEEKQEIIKQLPEKGCEPCFRSLYGMLHQDEVVGWGFDPESSFFEERDMRNWPRILSRTNLRAVPMSALGIATIFLNDRDPRTDRWMKTVKQSYYDFVDMFAPDGSYPEGTGYCRYTSEELILFLDILYRQKKQDWHDAISWQGVMDFLLMTRMPTTTHEYGHVNFGDGGHGFGSDIGFWVAKKFNDEIAQFAAINHAQRHNIFSVVWYDPKIKEKEPKGKFHYRRFDIDWVVVTTGFELDDFVVAMRSGGPANHENADRNSIILKSNGENLLVDNWHPPYSHLHPAWALRTSPAHNTVLIDGKGHQYHDGLEGTNASLAEAKVVSEKKTDDYVIVSSDATQAYGLVMDHVEQVMRTFLVIPGLKFLLVIDSLAAKEPAVFTARWFVDNGDKMGKIQVDGDKFSIQRPLAQLHGIGKCSLDEQLTTNKFPVPEEHGVYPHLDISATKKGERVDIISAMAVSNSEAIEPVISVKQKPINGRWRLKFNKNGFRFKFLQKKCSLNCR